MRDDVCQTCNAALTAQDLMKHDSSKYWKHCKPCRDKNTAGTRRRREAAKSKTTADTNATRAIEKKEKSGGKEIRNLVMQDVSDAQVGKDRKPCGDTTTTTAAKRKRSDEAAKPESKSDTTSSRGGKKKQKTVSDGIKSLAVQDVSDAQDEKKGKPCRDKTAAAKCKSREASKPDPISKANAVHCVEKKKTTDSTETTNLVMRSVSDIQDKRGGKWNVRKTIKKDPLSECDGTSDIPKVSPISRAATLDRDNLVPSAISPKGSNLISTNATRKAGSRRSSLRSGYRSAMPPLASTSHLKSILGSGSDTPASVREPSGSSGLNKDLKAIVPSRGPSKTITNECSVCAESHELQKFVRLENCEHNSDVCLQCFLTWLDHQLSSTAWDCLQCPSSGCNEAVTHADVQKYASTAVFKRFDELAIRSYLSSEPTFVYCLAPTCASGQIHDSGMAGPIFSCAACGFRMCTAHPHNVAFHEDESCAQYSERVEEERIEQEEYKVEARMRRKQEKASEAEVAKSSVECPGCGVMISKTAGCDHMTCRRSRCGFQFCYVCRAPYEGEYGILEVGNDAHAVECKHHSKQLPRYSESDGL